MKMKLLALFASVALTGCGGFVYNSPNHPTPVVIVKTEPVPVGMLCDVNGSNCKTIYAQPQPIQTQTTTIWYQGGYPYYGGMPNYSPSWCCTRQDGKWWRW